METYIFKLRFKGPTHFGETGIDLENVSERVQSDTLFSALVNAYKELNGIEKTTEFIQSFIEQPKFLISSLFVYKGDKYFLPRPLIDEHIDKEIKKSFGKDLKKIKWVDPEGFLKWQKCLDREEVERLKGLQSEYEDSYSVEIRPRVSLDRATCQSNIYHSGFVYFKKDAGLYGIVVFWDNDFISQFKNLLEILGEIGLGGEKTYGCGMFEIESFERVPDEFKEVLFGDSGNYTLLSLCHPDPSELPQLKEGDAAYDIVRKRGWITSGRYAMPFKRKSLGFFVEGSVFKKKPKGALVDVTPESLPEPLPHRIFRYGYALTAPLGGA